MFHGSGDRVGDIVDLVEDPAELLDRRPASRASR